MDSSPLAEAGDEFRSGGSGGGSLQSGHDGWGSARVGRSPTSDHASSTVPAGRSAGPHRPEAAACVHDVDVWRLDCARYRVAGLRFDSTLDSRERDRLRLMRSTGARLRFSAGRWLARHVLARRLGCREADVELMVGPHGRPSLACGGFDFNLSHAGSIVVLVLGATRVGIDVEATGRVANWRSIARRFFSAGETAAIEACAEGERRTAFFRTWVRKEAFAKAIGTGVATGFHRFDVSTGAAPALLAARIDGIEAVEWSIRDFEPGAGHLGAVAVRAVHPRIRVRDIEP